MSRLWSYLGSKVAIDKHGQHDYHHHHHHLHQHQITITNIKSPSPTSNHHHQHQITITNTDHQHQITNIRLPTSDHQHHITITIIKSPSPTLIIIANITSPSLSPNHHRHYHQDRHLHFLLCVVHNHIKSPPASAAKRRR